MGVRGVKTSAPSSADQAAARAVLGQDLPLGVHSGGIDATYYMGRAGIPTIRAGVG